MINEDRMLKTLTLTFVNVHKHIKSFIYNDYKMAWNY